MRRIAFRFGWWLFERLPLGRMAPHVFGWLVGSKPVRVTEEAH